MNKIKDILPGFIVCLAIGLIAQQISKFFPSIGAALFAIGIGMLAGNTFLNLLSQILADLLKQRLV